jgi:hypothetical protein
MTGSARVSKDGDEHLQPILRDASLRDAPQDDAEKVSAGGKNIVFAEATGDRTRVSTMS